jgi:hypothetical protein
MPPDPISRLELAQSEIDRCFGDGYAPCCRKAPPAPVRRSCGRDDSPGKVGTRIGTGR